MLDLKGLTKAQALAALYNGSIPLGMGFLSYDSTPMTEQEAQNEIDKILATGYGRIYFDYLKGRVMKLDFTTDKIDPRLYDRDNGPGAAQRAIDAYAAGSHESIEQTHKAKLEEAALEAKEAVNTETTVTNDRGLSTVCLGMADVKDEVLDAVERAKKMNQ